jgi:hypothetical protein
MFAGLAWGAGYVESVPNFEFLTVILFAGGYVLGPAWGALAGGLGAFLFSAVNPYGSGLAVPLVLAAQVAGQAFAGAVGGCLGRAPLAALPSPLLRAAVVVAAGVGVTLVYDLLTNLASAVLFGPLLPTLVAALPFAAVHVGTNALLFAGAGVALVGALERTRRSLLPPAGAAPMLAVAVTLALALAGVPGAGGIVPAAAAGDSLLRRAPAAADSTYRDLERRAPPPAWGDGPATLSRRGDGAAARWATREGGMTERFADERGSAEPLSRFGLPGARLELDWLGLPVAAPGAVGGASTRIPWHAVGAVEAPRLPVSARSAFRGEAGEARFLPVRSVPGHPRVIAWAGLGSNEHTRSGFAARAAARHVDGLIAVEASGLGPLAPLGPAGDHALAGALGHERGRLALEGAYRSAREAVEDVTGRPDTRAGEAGRIAARYAAGGIAWALALERTDERVAGGDFFTADTLSRIAKSDRARLEAARPWRGGRAWVAATYGRETLESDWSIAFPRRTAHLAWAAAGLDGALAPALRLEAALGAGRYGEEAATFAPSVLLERTLAPGTRAWVGAARGLGARLDPRVEDGAGDPVRGDPPVLASSTWLAGLGLERRSPEEEGGGDARGAWPRGAHRARAAAYAGRSTPGHEVDREPLAVDGARAEAAATLGTATEFVAFVADAACAPLHGLRLELGGHVLARRLDPALRPADPEWRVSGELELRDAFLDGDLDLRAGVLGEAIGPRAGTPVGDLAAASRLGVFAGFSLDDFHVRAEVRDVLGHGRFLPVIDPRDLAAREAAESRFLLEARWTFWD